MSIFIFTKIIYQISKVNIKCIADGYKIREADIFVQGPVQNRGTQGTGLGDKSNISFLGESGGKTCIQFKTRDYDTQTIRSDYTHMREFFQLCRNLFFQFFPFFSDLFESGRDNNHSINLIFTASTDQFRNLFCR